MKLDIQQTKTHAVFVEGVPVFSEAHNTFTLLIVCSFGAKPDKFQFDNCASFELDL